MEQLYYRNLINLDDDKIDAHSLFQKTAEGKMRLVDEDRFYETEYDPKMFYPTRMIAWNEVKPE